MIDFHVQANLVIFNAVISSLVSKSEERWHAAFHLLEEWRSSKKCLEEEFFRQFGNVIQGMTMNHNEPFDFNLFLLKFNPLQNHIVPCGQLLPRDPLFLPV